VLPFLVLSQHVPPFRLVHEKALHPPQFLQISQQAPAGAARTLARSLSTKSVFELMEHVGGGADSSADCAAELVACWPFLDLSQQVPPFQLVQVQAPHADPFCSHSLQQADAGRLGTLPMSLPGKSMPCWIAHVAWSWRWADEGVSTSDSSSRRWGLLAFATLSSVSSSARARERVMTMKVEGVVEPGNLATWSLGDLKTWRLGDLATWRLGEEGA